MAPARTLIAVSLAALCSAPVAAQQRSTGQAILMGRVLVDSTDIPVPDAQIMIQNQRIGATTDATGRFRIANIPSGYQWVVVRRLGFAPVSTIMLFEKSDTIDADFLMMQAVTALDQVNVRATLLQRKLRDFETRRNSGFGNFMTEAEFARMHGGRISDRIRSMSGLSVDTRGQLRSTRAGQRVDGTSCGVGVMLDNILIGTPDFPFDIDSVDPDQVAAVEYYSGPAQMPVQFSGTQTYCALLIIWTK